MGCVNCSSYVKLPKSKATLYFLSEFSELSLKTDNFFRSIEKDTQLDGEVCTFHTDNVFEFFLDNVEAFFTYFSDAELEDIKLFVDDGTRRFDFRAILSAKSLGSYLQYIEDIDFFDIVEHSSLTSYFQPIIDMKTLKIYGYEALVRGVHPDGSLMFPDQLFEKSARNDMNFILDRMSRESALKTAATKKINKKLFINFMPTSIYDPEYCLQSTVKWANQLEFNPSNIVFEVVETEQVADKEHLRGILEFYRKEGFSIALDDVGEGYSGLNNLIDIKPNIIKVDRNVIMDIDKDPLKQSVYKALYNIARENDIIVLAEGIETQEELEMIKTLGVDLAQGYYFAKPQVEPVRMIQGTKQ
ncbi:MAG: EAL domain-containing protein [Campylobacterales bacterium]|nr:EAL domain-containing protein [Campylobacterales bacterium]